MPHCAAVGFVLVGLLIISGTAFADASRPTVTLAREGKPTVAIVTAGDPSPAEQTAALELADYLKKATGGQFKTVSEPQHDPKRPAIYVGRTAMAKGKGLDAENWAAERWAVRTADDSLILVGGKPRGTLYAVYHFLEDVVGVRWWNSVEEYVPNRPTLAIEELDQSGEPRFRYRDIHLLYAHDGGRFAARNRINCLGFRPIDAKYGCGVYYGPPGGVHTFNAYVPPKDHFAGHPEWFSLIGDKRTAERAQLCLTNAELRAFVVKRLKGFIGQARADAERTGRSAPVDFDISQNDWGGMCQCANCQAISKAEGSESGPLIDFLNQVSDAVRQDFPGVRINTLAYQATDEAPKTIRPRASIIPRLCDTDANLLQPITHADNQPFAQRVAAWGKIVEDLRIWDYAVTYTPYYGLPLPTAHTYPIDYRYFAEHNVEGIFTEHEHPIRADMRDFKVWAMMKLLEDPYRDYDALVRDFMDGFYGPAGQVIRRYLTDLQAAADASGSNVDWFPGLSQYRYLTLVTVRNAQATFDEAEQSNNWKDVAKRVPDGQAESRITNRLELSERDMEKYKLPMPWGAYAPAKKRGLGSTSIKPEDVPGPGYHWYKLGTLTITPSSYVYFFWSWIIQFPVDAVVDPDRPDQKFEVWARIKFEGPGFPHGKSEETNAISVERVVLVRQPAGD